jgi:hypothetical protein
MSRLFGGLFKAKWQGSLSEGLFFDLGFALGGGREEKAMLVDTGPSVQKGKSSAFALLGGLDLKLQKIWRFENSRLINTLELEESAYRTINEKIDGNVTWSLPTFTHNWKFRTDYTFYQMNLHAIGAVYPYPSLLFPRFWSRVAEVSPFGGRHIRSYLGGGLGFTFWIGPHLQLAALGGIYAGDPGGELRMRIARTVALKAMTYQVENSSEYRNFSQRVYAAGLDISL